MGAQVTLVQCVTVLLLVGCSLVVYIYLSKTGAGMAIRAVASEASLAEALGLRIDRLHVIVICLGSALAGLCGILMAWDTTLSPGMALSPLMFAIIAVIVGGRRLLGSVVGAFLLGLALHLSTLVVATKWQEAVAFLILLASLGCRRMERVSN